MGNPRLWLGLIPNDIFRAIIFWGFERASELDQALLEFYLISVIYIAACIFMAFLLDPVDYC